MKMRMTDGPRLAHRWYGDGGEGHSAAVHRGLLAQRGPARTGPARVIVGDRLCRRQHDALAEEVLADLFAHGLVQQQLDPLRSTSGSCSALSKQYTTGPRSTATVSCPFTLTEAPRHQAGTRSDSVHGSSPEAVTLTSTDTSSPARDDLVDALLSASRAMVAISARSLADLDAEVTLPQFRAPVVLASRGPQRIVDIASALGVNPSTGTRMCDRLVAKKLVRRYRSSADRRKVRLTLTEAGRALVREAVGEPPENEWWLGCDNDRETAPTG